MASTSVAGLLGALLARAAARGARGAPRLRAVEAGPGLVGAAAGSLARGAGAGVRAQLQAQAQAAERAQAQAGARARAALRWARRGALAGALVGGDLFGRALCEARAAGLTLEATSDLSGTQSLLRRALHGKRGGVEEGGTGPVRTQGSRGVADSDAGQRGGRARKGGDRANPGPALWRLVAEFWWQAAAIAALGLCLAALSAAVPLSMGRLYDLATSRAGQRTQLSQEDWAELGEHVARALGMLLSTAVARAACTCAITTLRNSVEAGLRQRCFAALLAQDMELFDRAAAHRLSEYLLTDTHYVGELFQHIAESARALGKVAVGLVCILRISPSMAGLTLLMLPAGVPLLLASFSVVKACNADVRESALLLDTQASEVLRGIRTVRACAAEASEVERHSKLLAGLSTSKAGLARASAFHLGTFACLQSTALTAWLALGAALSWESKLSVGNLNAAIAHSRAMADGLGALGEQPLRFARGGEAAARLFSFLDSVASIEQGGGLEPESLMGRVAFRDVHFCYPTRPGVEVLEAFSLEMQPGSVTALVGSSGSGKSTAGALLLRMYDPSRGQVEIDGVHATRLEPHFLRQQIGVVTQEPRLFSGSIADNIAYGHAAGSVSREDIVAASKLAQAHDFIQSLPNGYDTELDPAGSRLSGGQKQRIAIARAVLGPDGRPPPILLLDEPTSALDAESEAQVQKALAGIMQGRTCLIIAHRLSTIKGADQICVLHEGRIVERGSHDALLAQGGFYAEFVRLSGGT